MDSILAWNVRSLNNCNKQNEVRYFLQFILITLNLFSLSETRVKAHNLGKWYSKVSRNWCFTHNLSYHENGRIVVSWCPNALTLNISHVNS